MNFNEYGMFGKNMGGTGSGSSTYYCDAQWFNNGQTDYALFGGDSSAGLKCGALCYYLNDTVSGSIWTRGAALSYKPRE
jgi:hypothetical protein